MPGADGNGSDLAIFATNLRRLRESRGMTRQQLGKRVGATKRQVEHWEAQESTPSIQHLIALYRAFKVPIEVLFEADDTLSLRQVLGISARFAEVLTNLTGGRVDVRFYWPGESEHPLPKFRDLAEDTAALFEQTRPRPRWMSQIWVRRSANSAEETEVTPIFDMDLPPRAVDTILDTVKASRQTPTDPQTLGHLHNPISESLPEPGTTEPD